MDRSDAANLCFRQVDRRAEVKGFGLDLIRSRKARAVEAVNRWSRRLRRLCDESVDIGLVKSSGHIRYKGGKALRDALLLDHEFGEINLVDHLGSEEAVKLGYELLADRLATIWIVQC